MKHLSNPYQSGAEKLSTLYPDASNALPEDFTEEEIKVACLAIQEYGLEAGIISPESIHSSAFTRKESIQLFVYNYLMLQMAQIELARILDIEIEAIKELEKNTILLTTSLGKSGFADHIRFGDERESTRIIAIDIRETESNEKKIAPHIRQLAFMVHELAHIFTSDRLGIEDRIISTRHSTVKKESNRVGLVMVFDEMISTAIDEELINKFDPEEIMLSESLVNYEKSRKGGNASRKYHREAFKLSNMMRELEISSSAIPVLIGHMREYFEDISEIDLDTGINYIKEVLEQIASKN